MSRQANLIAQPQSLFGLLMRRVGLVAARDKQTLCTVPDERAAALQDPATRRALSELSPEVLYDIGVVDQPPSFAKLRSTFNALHHHLW